MDDVQIKHERAVGDDLVASINRERKTNYVFNRRGDDGLDCGPDVIYCDENSELGIEVVTCYYDSNDAKLKWQNTRNCQRSPKKWHGKDFDTNLTENINNNIFKKCTTKDYGQNCLLAVCILPCLTTFKEMENLLPQVKIPPKHKFKEIYLIGNFGITCDSNVMHAIWRLFPS